MTHEMENRLIEAVAARQVVEKVWDELSDGQTIVASWIMDGFTLEEIALNMGVTPQSVASAVIGMRPKFKRVMGVSFNE